MMIFFFNDTATTEIYTLSLHDALPICPESLLARQRAARARQPHRGRVALQARRRARPELRARLRGPLRALRQLDRKSTRLNSSHANISYAVFCLKKKTWCFRGGRRDA